MLMSIIDKIVSSSRPTKRLLLVSLDAISMTLAFAFSLVLRMDSFSALQNTSSLLPLLLTVPASIFIFIRLGLYSDATRHLSSDIISKLTIGLMGSALLIAVASYFSSIQTPRSVPGIYLFICFVLIAGTRHCINLFVGFWGIQNKKPTLIYGVIDEIPLLINWLRMGGSHRPVAIVSSDSSLLGSSMSGLKIYDPLETKKLINRYNISLILLADPSTPASERRELYDQIEMEPVQIRNFPMSGNFFADIFKQDFKIEKLKNASIEELIGRDEIPPIPELISATIKSKTVLVTGAGGSIGKELCRQILTFQPIKLICLDFSEPSLHQLQLELAKIQQNHDAVINIQYLLSSIVDYDSLEKYFQKFSIQSVYHAAAYKHVPLVESNLFTSTINNVNGTLNLADLALKYDVGYFTLISSDKAVRPTNIMGATKRVSEIICQSFGDISQTTKFSTVRFGNVLKSSGSVIPIFESQISAGGPVTVTHPKISRYFMTISEAVELVLQASALQGPSRVFHLDMGEPIEILMIAKKMIQLSGFTPVISGQNDPKPTGAIEIEITGLRKGEKLFEELLIGDKKIKTAHPKIYADEKTSLSLQKVKNLVEEITSKCADEDKDGLVQLLSTDEISYHEPDLQT